MREVPQPMRMLPVAAKPSYGSNARFKRDNALLIHTIGRQSGQPKPQPALFLVSYRPLVITKSRPGQRSRLPQCYRKRRLKHGGTHHCS